MAESQETQKKTRVLYVITKSNFGGAQRYVYDLATACARGPYEVAVALGGTGARGADTGSLETKLTEAGIRTVRITHFMRDISLAEDIRAFFELVRIIRAEHPDVLHVTSSKAAGLGALAGRIAGVSRIVFTSHGLVFEESWRPLWQRALVRMFTWCTMLLVHATIQISRATYARAMSMPLLAERIHLVHNGIPVPPLKERAEAQRALGGDQVPGGVWIGTLAEYHPNKNLSILIDALFLLVHEGCDVHLWLVGEGEEREALCARAQEWDIEDRVHLTGYIPNAATLLKAFDIFALPSKKEGLPYVLLEAGHAGLPVVASDISGNNDVIVHETSGLLVPDNNTEKLSAALGALVRDPALRERYGTALKSSVTDTFSDTRMYEETRALYA